MKIIVCIKQVPDTETKIKLQPDRSKIDETGIKWVVNPYDEFAIEEALKVKEANAGSTVTVYSVGPKARVTDAIRTALAMGADDGVLIHTEENLDSFATAKALAKAIQADGTFDLVFTGRLAIDDNASSVSQLLAEELKIPHATVVSKFSQESGGYVVEREIEGGSREVIQLIGASVVGANKGLNTPRYASLPGIMKAKKKPIKEIELSSLSVSAADVRVKYEAFELPPEKPPVKLLSGDASAQAQELVRLLKDEAKVL